MISYCSHVSPTCIYTSLARCLSTYLSGVLPIGAFFIPLPPFHKRGAGGVGKFQAAKSSYTPHTAASSMLLPPLGHAERREEPSAWLVQTGAI